MSFFCTCTIRSRTLSFWDSNPASPFHRTERYGTLLLFVFWHSCPGLNRFSRSLYHRTSHWRPPTYSSIRRWFFGSGYEHLAVLTGFEPAITYVTGRHFKPLSYRTDMGGRAVFDRGYPTRNLGFSSAPALEC